MIRTFDDMLKQSLTFKGKRVAVVFPNNEETFAAVKDALKIGLAEFVLIGNAEVIARLLPERSVATQVVHVSSTEQALEETLELVRQSEVDILMKGSVDTSTLMKAMLREASGIRTGRLLSDVFVFEYPKRTDNKLIMITDGGVSLTPDLHAKAELIRNAVKVAHALGNSSPKVAVLSASEFVNPKLRSTTDAAALAEMNQQGVITGCVVAGPLALDGAISPESAAEKRLTSPVAGHAEILLAPDIESANMLAKSTTYFAGYRLAHVVVGGKVPILIPSRADKSDAKLLSIALGVVMNAHKPKS